MFISQLAPILPTAPDLLGTSPKGWPPNSPHEPAYWCVQLYWKSKQRSEKTISFERHQERPERRPLQSVTDRGDSFGRQACLSMSQVSACMRACVWSFCLCPDVSMGFVDKKWFWLWGYGVCITSDVWLPGLKGHTSVSGRMHYLDPFLQQLYSLGRETAPWMFFASFLCALLVVVLWSNAPSCEVSLLEQTAKVHLRCGSSSWFDLL